ncbi:hypothetical protein VMCG_06549 [Cytospora schulzeri]|uniref:Uncharacterized protein n=1 Tax=Cytospora schulzeri TaxID=448051 RepID=A0A423WBI6_9PEZI|nr:hypothetical protein VMCG_06549 [Valsa malicola]
MSMQKYAESHVANLMRRPSSALRLCGFSTPLSITLPPKVAQLNPTSPGMWSGSFDVTGTDVGDTDPNVEPML